MHHCLCSVVNMNAPTSFNTQYLGIKHHQRHCSVFLSTGTAPKWQASPPYSISSNPTMLCLSFIFFKGGGKGGVPLNRHCQFRQLSIHTVRLQTVCKHVVIKSGQPVDPQCINKSSSLVSALTMSFIALFTQGCTNPKHIQMHKSQRIKTLT